jgi:site-specific DNA recombinase
MKAIGYIRVSTEDQAREGISLDNQDAKIKAYASLNNMDLVEIISDAGISGKTMDRPGISRVLEMLNKRDVDAVIVYKLDRLSRKTLDNLTLIESFDKNGIAFHSIMEKIDTKSAQGRFFLTIISALAQMERDQIVERTKDALNHKRNKREWMGRIPYGYKVEDNHLVEDPAAIRTIQKAKRLKNEGKTYRDISSALKLSLGYVHRIINTDMRKIRNGYIKGYGSIVVH